MTTLSELAARVAERRRHIETEAPCDDCGTPLSVCLAQRGKDPTAPEWFGCCSLPLTDRGPCRHVPDPKALRTLLQEIEAGNVRPLHELLPVQGPRPVTMTWLLEQDEWWQPREGPMVRIADMSDTHRFHLARWLEVRAPRIALGAAFRMMREAAGPFGPSGDGAVDAFEDALDEVTRDPVAWLRGKPLYVAVCRGLPTPLAGKRSRKRWGRLVQRARHYSTCPRNRVLKDPECTCTSGVIET